MVAAAPEPGEHLIRSINEHWIRYVTPTIIFLLLFGVSMLLFVLAGISTHHWMWVSHLSLVTGLLLLLLSHHWFFAHLLSEATGCIIITNRRVIYLHAQLFAMEELREFSFDKVKWVTAHRSNFLQYIFNYGTLSFENGQIQLVPHPSGVVRDIEQAMGRK